MSEPGQGAPRQANEAPGAFGAQAPTDHSSWGAPPPWAYYAGAHPGAHPGAHQGYGYGPDPGAGVGGAGRGAGVAGLMEEIASGGSGLSSLSKMLNFDDPDFWKGAMLGAAAVLLLTNDSVQGALFNNGASSKADGPGESSR